MSSTSQRQRKRSVWGLLLLPILGLIGLVIAKATATKASAISSVMSGTKWSRMIPFFVAMSKHETDNYTSNVYKSLHSMFGMKVPSKRPFDGMVGPEAPDGGNYARYTNDRQSVRDLINWLDYVNFPSSITDLYSFVVQLKAKSYFTDSISNYYTGTSRFYRP